MSLPGDGRPSESLSVTVISAAVIPSAVTVVGNARSPAEGEAGGTNDSVAFCVKVTSSVVSSAVKLRFSVLRSVIEKTAAPSLSVTALGGVTVALPDIGVSDTLFPLIGNPLVSVRTVCASAVVPPSAGAEPSALAPPADANERLGLAAPGVKPVSASRNCRKSGDPRPTCAKSDPNDDAEWNALVFASGYRCKLAFPRLEPSIAFSAAA